MKSLKDLPSIRQVRLDHMLEITPQPDNTCPLIDPLIYLGQRRSPIYDLDIEYDPKHLLLDEKSLAERIETLEKWASEVVDVYSILDKSIIDADDIVNMDDYITDITDRIAWNKMYEVSCSVKTINDLIYDWQDKYNYYLRVERELDNAEKEHDQLESNFDNEPEDEGYEDAVAAIATAKTAVEDINEKLEELKDDFNSDVSKPFEKELNAFTELMESIRSNNDELRHTVVYLRDMVIEYAHNDFNVTQPMDYLKKLETGKPDEISLGLVDKSYYSHTFEKLTEYLNKHEVINNIAKTLLKRCDDVEPLLAFLKKSGYTTIRYYDDPIISIKHPELYKEVNFSQELINESKLKPRI